MAAPAFGQGPRVRAGGGTPPERGGRAGGAVGMGTHRRGSNPAHARDGTPKRGITSHARPALPSRLSLARGVGASGVKVQTPLPSPDWARHTAGGRQGGCLAARFLVPILPPSFRSTGRQPLEGWQTGAGLPGLARSGLWRALIKGGEG